MIFKKNNFEGTGYISASSLNFNNINITNPNLSPNTPTLELPSKTTQKGLLFSRKILFNGRFKTYNWT